MKNRTLCSALLALALVGCTMNGKKMFEFGGSSTSSSGPSSSSSSSSSGGGAPGGKGGVPLTPDGVYEGIPAGSSAEESAIEMDRRAINSHHELLARIADIKGSKYIRVNEIEGAAMKCREVTARLTKVGVTELADIGYPAKTIPTAQVEAQICAPLAKKAAGWEAGTIALENEKKAADAAEVAAFEDKLKAAGITGDRLRYAVQWRYDQLFTKGGILLETPKQIKAAKVIFLVKRHGSIYSYYRTEFAANDKIVTDTRKEYDLDPGLDGFR